MFKDIHDSADSIDYIADVSDSPSRESTYSIPAIACPTVSPIATGKTDPSKRLQTEGNANKQVCLRAVEAPDHSAIFMAIWSGSQATSLVKEL